MFAICELMIFQCSVSSVLLWVNCQIVWEKSLTFEDRDSSSCAKTKTNASVRQRFPHVIKVATQSHSSVDTRLLKLVFCTNSHRNVDTVLLWPTVTGLDNQISKSLSKVQTISNMIENRLNLFHLQDYTYGAAI